MDQLLNPVIANGVFACLFVWLLLDTRKDGKQREGKYQDTISSLVEKISVVEEIKEDVEAIKNKIFK
ncbi:BhlA/UviB family holin-like peptide [Clostridium gasigenes]|uniref:BhlA/UviB family holin-like peptide n=1 Tax=Clostridium gasigenes TaxID=94869 RepID=UPI001C0DC489|nr:bacteriocin [Clostridium gasigenes]